MCQVQRCGTFSDTNLKAIPLLLLGGALILTVMPGCNDPAPPSFVGQKLSAMVAKMGNPDYLATDMKIIERRVKALTINTLSLDPESVVDWNGVSNSLVIWVSTEVGRDNARFYYHDMKQNGKFDGSGWYSSRTRNGEWVTIVKTDGNSTIMSQDRIRVEAIAMHLLREK